MNKRDYEVWRPALIAFLEAEGAYMPMTLESLRKGWPLTDDNRRMIRALAAAHNVTMRVAA